MILRSSAHNLLFSLDLERASNLCSVKYEKPEPTKPNVTRSDPVEMIPEFTEDNRCFLCSFLVFVLLFSALVCCLLFLFFSSSAFSLFPAIGSENDDKHKHCNDDDSDARANQPVLFVLPPQLVFELLRRLFK